MWIRNNCIFTGKLLRWTKGWWLLILKSGSPERSEAGDLFDHTDMAHILPRLCASIPYSYHDSFQASVGQSSTLALSVQPWCIYSLPNLLFLCVQPTLSSQKHLHKQVDLRSCESLVWNVLSRDIAREVQLSALVFGFASCGALTWPCLGASTRRSL